MQLTDADVMSMQRSLRDEGKILHSVCGYEYMEEIFYVLNWKSGAGWTEVRYLDAADLN